MNITEFNTYALSIVRDERALERELDTLLVKFRELGDVSEIDYVVLSFLIVMCTESDVKRLIDSRIDFTCAIEDTSIRGEMDHGLLEIVISEDNVELTDFILRNIPKHHAKDFLSRIWAWQCVESERMAEMVMKYRNTLVEKVPCPRACITRACSYCNPLLYCINKRNFNIAKVVAECCLDVSTIFGPEHRFPIYILMGIVSKVYDKVDIPSFYALFESLLKLNKPRHADGIKTNCIGIKTNKNLVYYALRLSSKLQDNYLIDVILKQGCEPTWHDLMNAAEFGRYDDFVKLFSVFYSVRGTLPGNENEFSYRFACVLAEMRRSDIYEYLLIVFGHSKLFYDHVVRYAFNNQINLFVRKFEHYDITLFDMIIARMNIQAYVEFLKN